MISPTSMATRLNQPDAMVNPDSLSRPAGAGDTLAARLGLQSTDDQSQVNFQIQVGTSDLQNAENVRSQAEGLESLRRT